MLRTQDCYVEPTLAGSNISLKLAHPQDIYEKLRTAIKDILTKIDSNHENESILNAQKGAKEILVEHQNKIELNIKQLEENSEWHKFTIAFFGETNAGKSTIIETLRILLNEPSKLTQQKKFRELQAQLGITTESFEQLDAQITCCDESISGVQDEMKAIDTRFGITETNLHNTIDALHESILEQKKAMPWWLKIVYLFIRLKDESEKYKLVSQLKEIAQAKAQDHLKIKSKEILLLNEKQDLINTKVNLLNILEQLEPYADGTIIGDGRSDFTRQSESFDFFINNSTVAILDVPGIEGKEKLVDTVIQQSVQKAHAVFYITSKDSPPNEGTLAKIKQHLNDQTEVWSIFNKPITNPRQLKGDFIKSDDEKAALQDLDNILKQALGSVYQNSKVLSGLPGFFAVAEHLTPYSDKLNSQKKFLEKFNRDEILNHSKLNEFHTFLKEDVVGNIDYKIKKSNFNKANEIIKSTIGGVKKIHDDYFSPLQKEMKKVLNNSILEIDNNLSGLKYSLERDSLSCVDNFERDIRNQMYELIESDISDDSFKYYFKEYIDVESKKLERTLASSAKKEVEDFEKNIKKSIEKLSKRFKGLVNDSDSSVPKMDFNLEINIDNGIKVSGVIGTIVGGVLLAWNPAGWAILAISAIGLAFSFVKAVWGFFSTDYKKSQQKKNVDSNLYDICGEARKNIKQGIDKFIPQIDGETIKLKVQLRLPIDYISTISKELESSIREFESLSTFITNQYNGAKS